MIDSGLLTVNFFARPSYCHYYFGDYYDPGYARWGFRPWISAGVGGVRVGFGYDPLLVYYGYQHRGDPGWFNTQRERYTFLENHPADRPPRTYLQQTKIVNNAANIQFTNINKITNTQNNVVIAAPLTQVVKNTMINHGAARSNGRIEIRKPFEPTATNLHGPSGNVPPDLGGPRKVGSSNGRTAGARVRPSASAQR